MPTIYVYTRYKFQNSKFKFLINKVATVPHLLYIFVTLGKVYEDHFSEEPLAQLIVIIEIQMLKCIFFLK